MEDSEGNRVEVPRAFITRSVLGSAFPQYNKKIGSVLG